MKKFNEMVIDKIVTLTKSKKNNFFLCMYKMVNINKDTKKNNDIETIVDSIGRLWLNERNIDEKLGHKNLPAITNKYDQEYKKYRYELVNEPKY